MFSVARRLRFAGRNNQIKFASPRPNVKQKFSGNRQIIALSSFKNLYSIEIHRPLQSIILSTKIFSCKKIPLAVTKGFFFDWIVINDVAGAAAVVEVLPSRVLPVEEVVEVVHIRVEAVEVVAAAEAVVVLRSDAAEVEVAGAAADNRHHNNDDDDVCLCRDRANIYL